MGAYTIRRLLWIPVTVILTTIIVFLLVRFIPGNIIDLIASEMGAQGQNIDRAALMHMMGLDAPVYVQYGRWISGIFIHGSFGKSLTSQNPITPMIAQRVPLTFELGLMALLIGLIISLPIGIYSAIRQDSTPDYILRSISILLISVPSFWIGTMLILYSSIWFHWTPSMVYIPFIKNPMGNLGMMIIPAAILGSQQTGSTMRMTRTMMLETLRQDYIRTAWSKGLSERIVVTRHAMKNALIPVVTMVGSGIPSLVGGAVIIEQIFNLPGMGRLMMDALQTRDYPIISAVNVIMATIVIANNLLIDLTYGWLDPRIHYK
jgi:peptide/nickel transport system permease protein